MTDSDAPLMGGGETRAFPPSPPTASVDYVAWRLGYSPHSFGGELVRLIHHADGWNRAILRAAYPHVVAAYEAWERSDDGQFDPSELPDLPGPRTASCGCEVSPGQRWTHGEMHAHYLHTAGAMVLWLCLTRSREDRETLNQRVAVNAAFNRFLEAVAEAYPEATGRVDLPEQPE